MEHFSEQVDSAGRHLALGSGIVVAREGAAAADQLRVNVRATGPFAAVEVVHSFSVQFSGPESYYLFPLSPSSNVSRFVARVGGGCRELQLVDRQQVEGLLRAAPAPWLCSLLEGETQRVFCVPLGAIGAGERVAVELCYAELVVAVAGEFHFSFPLRPAPSFVVRQPDFSLQLILETGGAGCQRLSCTHALRALEGEYCWELAQSNPPAGDFVFRYRLGAQNSLQGGLHQRAQHFAYHLHAPVNPGTRVLPKVQVVLVDASENCQGLQWQLTKYVVAVLLNRLHAEDLFALVAFHHDIAGYQTGYYCEASAVPAALAWLETVQLGGRANMSVLLDRLLILPAEAGKDVSVCLLANGCVGPEEELLDKVATAGYPLIFDCVGIGPRRKTDFLERLARFTRGSFGWLAAQSTDFEAECQALLPASSDPGVRVLPRTQIVLVDASDNCEGSQWKLSKSVVAQVLGSLGPQDVFALVAFSSNLAGYQTGVTCAASQVPAALAWLETVQPKGVADMSVLLERLLSLSGEPGRDMSICLLANGPIGPEAAMYTRATSPLTFWRFHCVGIGAQVNAAFLRRLAAATRGRCLWLDPSCPDPLTVQKIVAEGLSPLLYEVELLDQGLGISEETLCPAFPLTLGWSDLVSVLGLKQGSGGLSAQGQSYREQPWSEKLQARASENPAMGMVWAGLKVRDLGDEMALSAEPKARRLAAIRAALALDYRLASDCTASLLTDCDSGHSVWLPSQHSGEWRRGV